MYYTFNCPKCDEENIAEVDVGEHIVDFSDSCENLDCQHEFTQKEKDKIYDDSLADCMGSMIDSAHDLAKDF